jgi:hypothetical protein
MAFLERLIKHLLEGLAVAIAAYVIPQRKLNFEEIIIIALTASSVFSFLDVFSPYIGNSIRHGSGFGIGFSQVSTALIGGDATNTNPNYVNETLNETTNESFINYPEDVYVGSQYTNLESE